MSDFILVVTTLFDNTWRLFETSVPGFDFSYADILLGVLFATIALNVVMGFLGHPVPFTGAFFRPPAAPRSVNNYYYREPRISPERSNDTK